MCCNDDNLGAAMQGKYDRMQSIINELNAFVAEDLSSREERQRKHFFKGSTASGESRRTSRTAPTTWWAA